MREAGGEELDEYAEGAVHRAGGAEGLRAAAQGGLGDHLGGELGAQAALLVLFHFCNGAVDAAAVFLVAGRRLPARGGEAGADISGHDYRDLDAVRPDLVHQSHGVAVDSRLGGGIPSLEGDGGDGGYRADQHDAAVTLTPHMRQDGSYRPVGSEEVDVDLGEALGGIGELHRSADAHPGAAYEDIYTVPDSLSYGGGHALLIGDVAIDMSDVRLRPVAAAEVVYRESAAAQLGRYSASDTRGGSGDYGCFSHCILPEAC